VGTEKDITVLSKSARIAGIIERRIPFRKGPFHPHSITRRVYRTPSSWLGTIRRLHPMAFAPRGIATEISSSGGMSPYLWLDTKNRLIRETENGKFVLADVSLLTDEDIAALEIGAKGASELLDAQYERALQAALNEPDSN
jgi:hypothetical protein